MEKVIDMLIASKMFESKWMRYIIFGLTIIFSLIMIFLVIENIIYNQYKISDGIAGLLSNIGLMLFLLTLIGIAKLGNDKIKEDEKEKEKMKYKIRKICRELKTKGIINFKKGGKNFVVDDKIKEEINKYGELEKKIINLIKNGEINKYEDLYNELLPELLKEKE